jgi:hypothetical protein
MEGHPPNRSIRWLTVIGVALFLCATLSPLAWAQASGPGAEHRQWQSVLQGEPFEIGPLDPQERWIADPVAAEQWKPVEQSDLTARLAASPVLQTDDVAPPPQRCWVGEAPYLVPAPGGDNWQMLLPYFNSYNGEQEVIIHDFASGETTRQYFNTEDDTVAKGLKVDFHMQPGYYTNGKLVIEMMGAVAFLVYDPAERRFVHACKPFGDEVIQGRAVLGEDGMIYGMGWPRDASGFVAYRFDPSTYETARYPTFGPANPNRHELYRDVTLSGDWIYAAIGNEPWHLVAFNVKTREGRVLATTEKIKGDHHTVECFLMEGGVSGFIRQAAEIRGIQQFAQAQFDFWLHAGNVYPRTNDISPWAGQPAKAATRQVRWGRGPSEWPRGTVPVDPPQFKQGTQTPTTGGAVELQYRLAGQDWRTLAYAVRMYPGDVARLIELNPDVLFAVDNGYGENVFYNVRTHQLKRVEGSVSPYSIGIVGDRLYMTGYPNSPIMEYEFTRPLGRKQEVPNPRQVAQLGQYMEVHYPMAGILVGADGRFYTGGDSGGRRRVGGGYGWYIPSTGEAGGEMIDRHNFYWGTSATDSRYILFASKFSDGSGGELFAWDTQTRQFIYQKALPFAIHPGPITEAMPGLVMGYGKAKDGKAGVLYGLKPDTGDVLWQKTVPVGPVDDFGRLDKHHYVFRRGPDGHIWANIGNALVRINPRNAFVQPVGRLDSVGQVGFTSHGVYLAGGKGLRRFRDLNVPPVERNAGSN